jgi:uncharacterized protein (TIGR02217 family)
MFHDVRFPTVIGLGATGGPVWNTAVQTLAGGGEVRVQRWAQAKLRWNVASGLRRREDFATLIAFFRARRGKLAGFRFKDFSDFELPRQIIGVTDGTTAAGQIIKTYAPGAHAQARRITRPVAGTVRCWVDNVERTIGSGGTQFQVNLATGIITLGATLAATTGHAIEVACEFDVPVRFDSDELALTLEQFDRGVWEDIMIVELLE